MTGRTRRGVLNSFTATLHADATVLATSEQVYEIVRDPEFVGSSTPFIRRVVVLADDLWRWEVAGIRYPGGTFTAALTQRMTLEPPHLVAFRHDPDGLELAGADGTFRVSPQDAAGRVRLTLEVHVHARVPAPRAAAPVVEAAMHVVMGVMRDRFVRDLERRLEA